MNKDDIMRMAKESGAMFEHMSWVERDLAPVFYRFANLVAAAEREKLAAWMIQQGYATGHGDNIEDLLKELCWQVQEKERNEIIDLVAFNGGSVEIEADIRARSQK